MNAHSWRGFRRVGPVVMAIAMLVAACVAAPGAWAGTSESPPQTQSVAQAPAKAAEKGIDLHADPVWLLVVAVSICLWFYLTSWVASDAKGIGLNFFLLPALVFAAGAIGLLLIVLVHAAMSFVMVAFVLGSVGGYIARRNLAVPEKHRLFGAYHFEQIMSKLPGFRRVAQARARARAAVSALPLSNESGTTLEAFLEEQPALSQPAAFLTDIILRAGATGSRQCRLLPAAEGYAVQYLMDGMQHNADTAETEIVQQVIGCAAQFVGLSKEGRVRQGSSKLSAQLPGRDKVQIEVQIAAVEGKPVLTLNFPDWSADLYKAGLQALGMHEAISKRIRAAIQQGRGMIVFCSDPGMGRTTTLYAAIGAIDILTTDVIVIDKKQEHTVDHTRQLTIPTDMPFGEFWQSVLRESPQAIVFGNLETKEQAHALLGFAASEGYVMTALRSPDGPEGLVALAKLAGDAALVGQSTTCLVGQQLLRRLCTQCREQVEPNPNVLQKLGIDPAQPGTWYRAVGCEACLNSGYRGRIGIFSMLIVTEPVKQALKKPGVTGTTIRQAAGQAALRTLYQDALSKVTAGITTLDEVRRVLKRQ